MTALNAFVQRDRVHVVTDGASYLADGTISAIAEKVAVSAKLGLVLSARGADVVLVHVAGELFARAQTFDEAAGSAVEVLEKTLFRLQGPLAATPWGLDYELMIAGWSESRGPSLYLVHSHGPNRWELQPATGYVSPSDDALASWLRIQGFHPDSLHDAPAAAAARAIVGAQRARTWPGREGAPGFHQVVGGFCQLTTVSRDGITTRILERWPQDRVGCKIEAAAELTG